MGKMIWLTFNILADRFVCIYVPTGVIINKSLDLQRANDVDPLGMDEPPYWEWWE